MKWIEFLNQLLDEKQIEVLRYALKNNAPVHFHGAGLGKSTIAEVLRHAGYCATEPGEMDHGYSNYVPDGSNCISFNAKRKPLEKLIPDLRTVLMGQKEEIIQWVQQEPMNLQNTSTFDLVKELESRAGVRKISTGPYRGFELRRKYKKTSYRDVTPDYINAETVLVVEPEAFEEVVNEQQEPMKPMWRRFEIITADKNEREELEKLLESKDISRDDLMLILRCIKFNDQYLGTSS